MFYCQITLSGHPAFKTSLRKVNVAHVPREPRLYHTSRVLSRETAAGLAQDEKDSLLRSITVLGRGKNIAEKMAHSLLYARHGC